MKPIRTDEADWEWQKSELTEYISGNYENLTPEDHILGSVAVAALAAHAREHDLFGKLPWGIHAGAGGVPRGSAIIAPLIRSPDEGGYIDVSDLGQVNIAVTRQTMNDLALGKLGIWQSHQENMTAGNAMWDGSFERAGRLANVHKTDIRSLQPESESAIALEYVLESITEDPDEYQDIVKVVCDALGPGGLLYMAYMIGSTGYLVGNKTRPAVPVTVDTVGHALRSNGMKIIINAGTDPSNQARVKEDTHNYDGMGIVIAAKAA
jgi:hypothetical protein